MELNVNFLSEGNSPMFHTYDVGLGYFIVMFSFVLLTVEVIERPGGPYSKQNVEQKGCSLRKLRIRERKPQNCFAGRKFHNLLILPLFDLQFNRLTNCSDQQLAFLLLLLIL